MKCFIVAMQKEAAPMLSAMRVITDRQIRDLRIVSGELYGECVFLVVCGVGKVNAARGTQYAVDVLGADMIVNLGVAGGLNRDLRIGAVYGISAVVQYDYDLTQLNGTAPGTLDECKENYLPLSFSDRYPFKKLGTGDRFNDSADDYRLLTEILGADIRDMECGAIAQVCMHCGVKCYAFKIISDLAGSGSTTEQYLNNLKLCFDTLQRELKNIVKSVI